jgi:ribosomal-protein-alanine N-acetyltransferase
MTYPTLHTKDLTLRPVASTDQQKIFEGFSNPVITEFFEIKYDSFEATNVQMEWYKSNAEAGTGYAWIVCNNKHEFMGVFTLHYINQKHKRAELGYWLFPNFWGKGIAKQAIDALLTHAQTGLTLHRISAEIEPANIASQKLLAHFGFEREGVLRDFEIKDGNYSDLEIWAKILE